MREDAEQGIVDLVCCAQGQLGQGRILFVLSKLCLELGLFLVEFALFVEPAEEFFLGEIALLFALPNQTAGLARAAGSAQRGPYYACAR